MGNWDVDSGWGVGAGGGGGGADPNTVLHGGNAFGATMVVGTTDGFDFELKADDATMLRLIASGNVELIEGVNFVPETDGEGEIGADDMSFNAIYSEEFTVRNAGEASFRAKLDAQNLIFEDGAGSPVVTFAITGATTAIFDDATQISFNNMDVSVGGDMTVNGKLTVTGSIDPTDIVLSGGGTAHFMEWDAGSTAATAALAKMRLRFNELTNKVQVSINAGSYEDLLTGSAAAILQGGNSFGATVTIGSNDAQSLALETGGATWVTLDTVGRTTMNPGTTAAEALLLDMATPGVGVERDSHWIALRGASNDGSAHTRDFRMRTDITSTAGLGRWTLDTQLDGGGWTNVHVISSAGAHLGVDGSQSNPTYSFASDSDTGIFRSAANTIAFTTSGSSRVTINASGQMLMDPTGSAAAPIIAIDNTNLGFFKPTGGAISFSSSGTETVRWSGTGTQVVGSFMVVTALGDAEALYSVTSGGFLAGPGGATAEDCRIRRSATKTLTFDDGAGGDGTFVVTGKLTVTGSIDPTDIVLSGGGTAHFMQWGDGSTAAVSAAGTMRLRYNGTTLQASYNGGAYADVGGGGGGGGWTLVGDVVQVADTADTVVIGAAAMAGTEKLRVIGDVLIEGILSVDDGSVSSPAVYSTSESQTGLYWTPDTLNIALGGDAGPSFTRIGASDITTLFPSNSTPSVLNVARIGDTDTGFKWGGDSILAFVSNGFQAFEIRDPNGAFAQTLFSDGDTTYPGIAIGTQNGGMYASGASSIGIAISSSPVFQLNNAPASDETAMQLLVDRGGTPTFDTIKVGATDTGGTGFRALVIDN